MAIAQAATYSGGTGTEANPYRISTAQDLAAMSNASADELSKHFLMTNDINMSGITGFTGIGGGYEMFAGVFNGGKHEVINLSISRENGFIFAALFPYVSATGRVEHLGIRSGSVSLLGMEGESFVGGLAAINQGLITDCYAMCTVSCGDKQLKQNKVAGGLVGDNFSEGIITDSFAICTVSCTSVDSETFESIGGLVGRNSGQILRCFARGMVSANGQSSNIGGLIGFSDGTVTCCYATGRVQGASQYMGGLIGVIGVGSNPVSFCYAACTLTGTGGGLIGSPSYHAFTRYCHYSVEASFWDIGVSGCAESSMGKGLSTAQMKTPAIYGNAGWGTIPDWVMHAGQYPRLAWEGTGAPAIPPAGAVPLAGEGTEAHPYLVSTVAELAQLSWHASILDKHILLAADLDCAGCGLLPVGDLGLFTGVFDGSDHTLLNVSILRPNSDFVGLFSHVGAGGVVRRLRLKNSTISGRSIVGGLVAWNVGAIENCNVAGVVTGGDSVGGLIGVNGKNNDYPDVALGTVTASYSKATVTGNNCSGGGIGTDIYGFVRACYASGPVTGIQSVGGLSGNVWESEYRDCHATGTVEGLDDVGGLVGRKGFGYAFECYATGAVTGQNSVGGLVGEIGNSNLSHCFASGQVNGVEYVGGLIGFANRGTSNCFATGPVFGSEFVGGLVGYAQPSGGAVNFLSIDKCYATGAVNGTTQVGGLAGFIAPGAYTARSFWDRDVGGPDNGIGTGLSTTAMKQRATFESVGWDFGEPPAPPDFPGRDPVWFISEGVSYPRLFGIPVPIDSIAALQELRFAGGGSFVLVNDIDARETAGWVSKSGAPGFQPIGSALQPFNGTLDGQGHRIYGLHIERPGMDDIGLFGCLGPDGVVRGVGLEDVRITGANRTGGLAGVNLGKVEQCYVQGTVAGAEGAGGLVGENAGLVDESYAAATLAGIAPGGLVGSDNGGYVSSSFWDLTVSGATASRGGIGLSTDAMMNAGTYDGASWDLTAMWTISQGLSYPYFQNSVLLHIVTPPPRLVNADWVDIEIQALVPGLFVTVGGGAYPAYVKVPVASPASLQVRLRQEAINRLTISVISEMGVESVVTRYDVYESAQFPAAATALTGLTLAPSSVPLGASTRQQFACTATFADGTTGDATPVATWNVSGGKITSSGLYTHTVGTSMVQALLHTHAGWQYSNMATVSTAKVDAGDKAGTGLVNGVVRSHYTGLGLPSGRVTSYNLHNPTVAGQFPIYDTLGNYFFYLSEGRYHFEGACAGHRSEIVLGGRLLEEPVLIHPGPPPQYSGGYYTGQVKTDRPLSYEYALRPNDTGAPWVVFIEPVADTTVNTEQIVVTAIDADQYSELSAAQYTHNTQEYAIPDRISSTGFYRDTWPLELGLNVLHLYTMDTEGNASEKTIQITYDPDYTGPDGDSDGDGMPNVWERAHGLNPNSVVGVNGAWGDMDGDGLSNLEEYQRGLFPNSRRSDSDILEDGFEVQLGTDPLNADTDGDGIDDGVEWTRGSDPLRDDRIKMAVVNPANGASVRGDAVTLVADTLEGYSLGSVASVSFEVRGVSTGGMWRVLGTAVTTPFTATWDTTLYSDGAYQVRAVAASHLGCVDGSPQAIALTVSPSATYHERVEGGVHTLSAPVAASTETVLALRNGNRFARITIPADALSANDTLTAFFPDASGFTPVLSTFQRDAELYLDVRLAAHTGNFLSGKRAVLEVVYPDADRDDHLDDTDLRVPLLSLNYLPTPAGAFTALTSPTIDRRTSCVCGETSHFSVFGIVEEQPAPPLNLLTDTLPQGTVGTPYSVALDADGGAPPYTWTVVSGALPSGLSVVGGNLQGTPTAAGEFTFTLQVSDTQTTPYTATRSYIVGVFAVNQPTVTVTRKTGQPGIANALPARWEVAFSEAVTGFDNTDVALTGTASAGAVFTVSGSGAVYTLEVLVLERDGTLHPKVPAGKASSIATGALNGASVNEDEVWVDRKKPQVQMICNYSGLQEYGVTGPIVVKSLPVLFTLSFDEPVTGLGNTDITFVGLSPQPGFQVLGSGKDYTLLITGATGPATFTPSLLADAAIDAAGNGVTAAAYAGREVQYVPETRATVTLDQATAQADPARVFPIVFNILFSESVTGFTTGDVVYIGTAPNPQYAIAGGGAAYTLTATNASGDGRIAFRIPGDVVNGGNAASTSLDNVVTYDATPPGIVIGPPSATKTRQGPVSFSVQYTGAQTVSLNAGHITLEGTPTAQVSVTGSGSQSRVVTLSGMSELGALRIRISPDTAVDAAGNLALAAGPSATVTVDPRLTVTVNQSPTQRDPNNRLPIFFDVEFIEAVTGFDADDVTMGGTATGVTYEVTGSGASYVIAVTGVVDYGTLIPSIAANRSQGVWGGLNVASTSTDNTVLYDPTLALALFSGHPTSGGAPLTVQFTDESILGTLPIEEWLWDFGDGETGYEQHPVHIYEVPGDYTVALTVFTATGNDIWTMHDYIHVDFAIPALGGAGLVLLAALLALGGAVFFQDRAAGRTRRITVCGEPKGRSRHEQS